MPGTKVTDSATIRFTKGHGTENDFVLIADQDASLDLTDALVRALTDRRAGVGGDGVIRLVPSAALDEGRAILAEEPAAEWFMDYRNADGSLAEMCGNGVRVFAAFLERLGLADLSTGELVVGTRAGVRRVRREPNGWYAVDMGVWSLPGGERAATEGADAEVSVTGLDVARAALRVDVGNPHTVLALADERELRPRTSARHRRWLPNPIPGPTSSSSCRSVSGRATAVPLAGCGCACSNVAWGRPARAGPVRAPPRWRSARGPAQPRWTCGSSTSPAGRCGYRRCPAGTWSSPAQPPWSRAARSTSRRYWAEVDTRGPAR